MIGFPIVLAVVIVAVVFLVRHPERRAQARFLKGAGFGLMVAFSTFFGLFVIGETFNDPGGWEAVGWLAAWLVPIVMLALLAWFRPRAAIRVFQVLIAVVIGVSIWFALDPAGWRTFEDRNGPIRTLIVFALSVAIALLGLKRTKAAGWMLLVLGSAPILISSLGSGLGFASLVFASSPTFVAGILYVISASMTDGTTSPGRVETGPRAAPPSDVDGRGRRAVPWARLLRGIGFGLMMWFVLGFVDVVAETFGDVGGWKAIGLIALALGSVVALTLFAWWRPDPAIRVFVGLIAAVLAVSVWSSMEAVRWHAFEEDHGPIRAIIVLGLSIALGALGLKRTKMAGAMLVTLGIVSLSAASLGGADGLSLDANTSFIALIVGGLYLLSAWIDGSAGSLDEGEHRVGQLPRAA